MEMMEKKLRKVAMLYLYDLYEEMTYEDCMTTFEEWMKFQEYEFKYEVTIDGSRIDATLFVNQYGEHEAFFTGNIAR